MKLFELTAALFVISGAAFGIFAPETHSGEGSRRVG